MQQTSGRAGNALAIAALCSDDCSSIDQPMENRDGVAGRCGRVRNVIKLREVMKDESKASWHQALFQLIRDSREMKFEFSYDNEMRWQVTPRNLEQMVRGLRPH